jgi:U3 small nucleolar RNA-associated protein 21
MNDVESSSCLHGEDRKSKWSKESRVFVPYRILGQVTNHVPFSLQARGTEYFLTTSIGRAFHIYNVDKLDLLFVSAQTDEPIVTLASHDEITFTGIGSEIWLWHRANYSGKLVGPSKKPVKSIMVFGDYLIVVHEQGCIRVWEYTKTELYLELCLDFEISYILHPSTYLNKILIASMGGQMQLWNVKTNELIYQFETYPWSILSLAQSPVVDVVAIGLQDGSIHLRNLKYDQELFSFRQDDQVIALAFRTDGENMLVSANTRGDIACWDLERRKLTHLIRNAHDGMIGNMQFLSGQAVLISSGADNAIREWIFDEADGSARLLKFRSGHAAPPTRVRFYGGSGHDLLSAGDDRSLRYFSILRDSQNCELSQGSLAKKSKKLPISVEELRYPAIVQFACSDAKLHEWETVLSCHQNECSAHTWRFDKKVTGKHSFVSFDGSLIKVSEMTTRRSIMIVIVTTMMMT